MARRRRRQGQAGPGETREERKSESSRTRERVIYALIMQQSRFITSDTRIVLSRIRRSICEGRSRRVKVRQGESDKGLSPFGCGIRSCRVCARRRRFFRLQQPVCVCVCVCVIALRRVGRLVCLHTGIIFVESNVSFHFYRTMMHDHLITETVIFVTA